MKRVIIFSLFLSLIQLACTNPESTNDPAAIMVEAHEIYEYHTGAAGDEEGALILTQANHYDISEISRDSTTDWEAVYRYQPASGFEGFDSVEIEVTSNPTGLSADVSKDTIWLHFEIIQ